MEYTIKQKINIVLGALYERVPVKYKDTTIILCKGEDNKYHFYYNEIWTRYNEKNEIEGYIRPNIEIDFLELVQSFSNEELDNLVWLTVQASLVNDKERKVKKEDILETDEIIFTIN